ncbi:SAM-dependent methyltransferase [Cyanobium sp. PCC 7001]|uniref:tRNA (5-methylaminomethyl-2-thiouridine)(34)-methyltransferase MnmD n=1 Tax=Cyanobium sp. PCC 7001 TaxID=180281 RepID=UPI0001804B08|nr:MnmC family methyltransferase [Cyanobium sp. PCC 7001]EDY39439.1 SAM-dependent methyltransferase [Cyanobium sp. PCC 7001]
MTSSASPLRPRVGADGSFSLFSEAFGEGFHSAEGALREARLTYVRPAELQRLAPGGELRVLDVGVGLGYNSAALIEAASGRGLTLQWLGLELDRRPLALALEQPGFQAQWQPSTLGLLRQILETGQWSAGFGQGRLLWGDARQQLPTLEVAGHGCWDLILLDAFSPRRCPQLWSQEFLQRLAGLLAPRGRLLTYCSAAAVRSSLQAAGLALAAIRVADDGAATWSGGTAASPSPLLPSPALRSLSAMERDHLGTRAAEPYRDPTGTATAEQILAARQRAQASGARGSTSAWRRRWGLPERGPGRPGRAT